MYPAVYPALTYPPETGIRLVGVTVSNFEAPVRIDAKALPLFGTGDDARPHGFVNA